MSPILDSIGSVKSLGWGSFSVSSDFESISTITVGTDGAANVEFTSIPSTYTHLQIRISAQSNRGTFGSDYNNTTLNNDTGSNYARHTLGGDGSTAFSGGTANGSYISGGVCGTSTGGTFGASIIEILDYANANKYKTTRVLSGNDLNGSVGGYPGEVYMLAGLWTNTNPITSIKFVPNSGTLYTQHTKFALYGIRVVA